MRISIICGVGAVALLCGSAAHAQNLLANPSFEAPVTSDGPPFVGSWEAFSGGPGAGSGNSTNSPRTGTMSLELSITGVNNTFAGAFQDVPGLVPGSPATFSGFQQTTTPIATLGVASEYRIEFRNSVTNTGVFTTPNVTVGPLSDQYTPFTISAVVPIGADTARVVYAIQTFGGEPALGDTGVIHLDDLSFVSVQVPEPTTLAAIGAASLLVGRRRR